MKKFSIFIAALLALGAVSLPSASADAQTRHRHAAKRGHKHAGKRTVTKRHHVRTHGHSHTSRHSVRTHRHHSTYRRTHRHHHRYHSGVHVRLGWPHYYGHSYPHRYHHHHHHRTVIVDPQPDVVVVEAEPVFEMPALECPIRTREERSVNQQWCSTPRGTKHGPFVRWYDNGTIAAQGEYEYDAKHGLWTEYHPNGAMREEGSYKDGERVGMWITWGSDGEELVAVDY